MYLYQVERASAHTAVARFNFDEYLYLSTYLYPYMYLYKFTRNSIPQLERASICIYLYLSSHLSTYAYVYP